jgi:hypothetical protein
MIIRSIGPRSLLTNDLVICQACFTTIDLAFQTQDRATSLPINVTGSLPSFSISGLFLRDLRFYNDLFFFIKNILFYSSTWISFP